MDARSPAPGQQFATPAGSRPAIALQALEVTLKSRAGQVEILKGVDVSIAQGEAVSVVGPSGSGKTTLLMVIAGLEQATGGKVFGAGGAAELLGMKPTTLTSRLRKFGIDRKRV